MNLLDSTNRIFDMSPEKLWHAASTFPVSINFALSSLCQAKCAFCHKERGISLTKPTMDYELARKIIDEASEEKFAGRFVLGDMGDAFLNPDIFRIFQYLRKKLPLAPIRLVTNMANADKRAADFLLRNKLTELMFNIDGSSKETYELVKKGLDFERISGNIRHFLKRRKELNSSCKAIVKILTVSRCYRYIMNRRSPYPDDSRKVMNYWKEMMNKDDIIYALNKKEVFLWRGNKGRPRKILRCPFRNIVLGSFFAAPDGQIYFCCLDYKPALRYGDVNKSTIKSIWQSEERWSIIRHILKNEYDLIGPPCNACPHPGAYK